MAEKALIKTIDYVKKIANGDFQVGFTAIIGYGTESYIPLTCVATAPAFDAILPTWRERMKAAIIATALSDYGLVVDGVLFSDLGIITV